MLSQEISRESSGIVISISLLFVLPACVTALIVFLTDMSGKRAAKHYTNVPLIIMGVILLASALTLREGIICILMIAPFWFLGSYAGSRIVYRLQQKYKIDGGGLNCLVLAALPFLTLFVETQLEQPTQHYTVERSVIIDAPVEDIWPLLVKLEDISPDEGRWNVTQNILGVPRPAKATLDMSQAPYIRHAGWGEHVTFEEHITTAFEVNKEMAWEFVFPNDSVSAYTDRHISADGYHLKIKTGGYKLETITPKQTKLTLETNYRATSPVNLYAGGYSK